MADPDLYFNLDELERAAQSEPKQRPSIVSQVDAICQHAEQHGLPSKAIGRILKVVTQQPPLATSGSRLLIENLYPSELVPKQTVYSIVAALGPGALKPVPAIQALLARWLILVCDVFEERQALAHVYSVLFNLIKYLAIRTDLCHLLAVTTERRHVKPFRVNMLINVQEATGQDPALTGLLRVYHSFRPDLVPKEALVGRFNTFDYPNVDWKSRMDALLEGEQPVALFEDDAQFRVLSKSDLRAKASHIPVVYTNKAGDNRPILEEINGINDFVDKFTQLQLPYNMAPALNDPLFQHYLETVPYDSADKFFNAVDVEVEQALNAQRELIELGEPLDKGCVAILNCGLGWAQRFKFLLPSVSQFCKDMTGTKQGYAHVSLLCDLLAWSNPYYEADWSNGILAPETEAGILASGDDGPIDLLKLYTQMIYNRLPTVSTNQLDADVLKSLDKFANHVSVLALSILATSDSTQAHLNVVAFLHALADIATLAQPDEHQWSLVPFNRLIVYLLAFSTPSLAVLSQLCGALADQKETIFNTVGRGADAGLKPGLVTTFNGFIMDLSNLLWRSRAFGTQGEMDVNATGCMLSATAKDDLHKYVTGIPGISPQYSLLNFFGVSFHPALANIAAASWRQQEDEYLAGSRTAIDSGVPTDTSNGIRHRGPVSKTSLHRLENAGGVKIDWLTYRLGVLQWLRERGAPGIDTLMKRTIKALMDGGLPNHQNLTNSQTDSPRLL